MGQLWVGRGGGSAQWADEKDRKLNRTSVRSRSACEKDEEEEEEEEEKEEKKKKKKS